MEAPRVGAAWVWIPSQPLTGNEMGEEPGPEARPGAGVRRIWAW